MDPLQILLWRCQMDPANQSVTAGLAPRVPRPRRLTSSQSKRPHNRLRRDCRTRLRSRSLHPSGFSRVASANFNSQKQSEREGASARGVQAAEDRGPYFLR